MTAMGVSANAVIVNTDNRAPEFKGQPSSLEDRREFECR